MMTCFNKQQKTTASNTKLFHSVSLSAGYVWSAVTFNTLNPFLCGSITGTTSKSHNWRDYCSGLGARGFLRRLSLNMNIFKLQTLTLPHTHTDTQQMIHPDLLSSHKKAERMSETQDTILTSEQLKCFFSLSLNNLTQISHSRGQTWRCILSLLLSDFAVDTFPSHWNFYKDYYWLEIKIWTAQAFDS